MNAKHEMFCREYIVDLNATRAAVRAGYSEKSARVTGCRLLADANISARVDELKQERMEQLALDAYWVLKRLKDISDRAMQAVPVMVWDHLNNEYRETGEYQFDGASATRAAELIGKHIGMFSDKLKVDMKMPIIFVDNIPDDDEEDITHDIHD